MSDKWPHTPEKKEKEYAPEELSRIVFWGFAVSQGGPTVSESAYILLLMHNPGIVKAAQRLYAEVGEDDMKWKDHPLVSALTDDVHRFVNSERHTNQDIPRDQAVTQVRGELGRLFRSIETSEAYKTYATADPMLAFINKSMRQEVILVDKDIADARARFGGSMLCYYALSPNREVHLAGSREIPPLSPEWQNLWRQTGDYIRTRYANIGPTTRERLAQMQKMYEITTGEQLVFGE